jgi:outer membrane protein assembly factor BamE (lipoprotein component of BamABCDE complex)
MIQLLSRIALVALFALALAGCGSKINQANFDKIATEMSRKQVEAILGAPAETSSTDIGIASGGSSTWKDENGTITVQFLNDKVMTKTFMATQAK